MGEAEASREHIERGLSFEPVFASALCAVNGKEGGYAAIEQAAALAGPRGHLTLLVATSYRTGGARRSPAIGPLRAKAIVYEASRVASATGVPFEVEVEPAAPPSRVILEWAAEYDLLAIGAPATSWLGGLIIAGVGDSALSYVQTPVLVARPAAAGGRIQDRVLLASDGLEGSEHSVELAGLLAAASGATVTLLHAVGHLHHGRSENVVAQGEALRRAGAGEPDVLMRPGSAHEVIVGAAREIGASLVVMGSRSLGGVRAIGSVSRRVVHEAGCSVLLVPPALRGESPG